MKFMRDIRGGSVVRMYQITTGWPKPAIFGNFGRDLFETFTVEANTENLYSPSLVATNLRKNTQ